MVNNSGVAVFKKQLSVGGDLAAKTFPSGWGGNNGTGIKTFDVYASGTVGAGDGNGNLKAYINTFGDIHADRNITASGNMDANGRVNAGEFVYINGQANVGWGCSPNGLQGRTPEGAILSCVNGLWSNSFSGEISSNTFNLGFTGTINLGVQKFCAIGSYRSDSEDDGQCQVYKSGANWYITTSQQSHVGCSAVCFK